MLVQTVVLSVALIATLIILFACIGGNINLRMENTELKKQELDLRFRLTIMRQEYGSLLMKFDKSKSTPASPEILETVHYAMIKAHPDNGGKQEDFIKFRKLYERLNNEYR